MRVKRHAVEKARIELIPMIDTMAFLLVFFMIASLAMTQQLGMPVNLPRASSAVRQPSADHTLVVSIDHAGHLFLNKQAMKWDELQSAVKARLAARPGLTIVLNADEGLRHGAVVKLMDALRHAGAAQISESTQTSNDATKP